MATTQVLDLEFRVPSGKQVAEPFDAIVAGEAKARQAQSKSINATIQGLGKTGSAVGGAAKKLDQITASATGYGKAIAESVGKSSLLAKVNTEASKAMAGTAKTVKATAEKARISLDTLSKTAEKATNFPKMKANLEEMVDSLQDMAPGISKFFQEFSKIDDSTLKVKAGFGLIGAAAKALLKKYTALVDKVLLSNKAWKSIEDTLIRVEGVFYKVDDIIRNKGILQAFTWLGERYSYFVDKVLFSNKAWGWLENMLIRVETLFDKLGTVMKKSADWFKITQVGALGLFGVFGELSARLIENAESNETFAEGLKNINIGSLATMVATNKLTKSVKGMVSAGAPALAWNKAFQTVQVKTQAETEESTEKIEEQTSMLKKLGDAGKAVAMGIWNATLPASAARVKGSIDEKYATKEVTEALREKLEVVKDEAPAMAGFALNQEALTKKQIESKEATDEFTTAIEIAIPKVAEYAGETRDLSESVEKSKEESTGLGESFTKLLDKLTPATDETKELTEVTKDQFLVLKETNKEIDNHGDRVEDLTDSVEDLTEAVEDSTDRLGELSKSWEHFSEGTVTGVIATGLAERGKMWGENISAFRDVLVIAKEFEEDMEESSREIGKTIADISRQSDTTIKETVGNMRKLSLLTKTMNLNLEETEKFMVEYQKMLVVYSKTGSDTAKVTSILNKALVQNRLSAEDLAVVFEEAPELFEKMANAAAFAGLKLDDFTEYNYKTLNSLKDLAEQGKLNEQFFKEFVKEIAHGSREIDQQFSGIAASQEVQAERLKLAWGELGDEFSRLPFFFGKIAAGLTLFTKGAKESDKIYGQFLQKSASGTEGLAKGLEGLNWVLDKSATGWKILWQKISLLWSDDPWRVDEMDHILNLLNLYPDKLDKAVVKVKTLKEQMAELAQFQQKWNKEVKIQVGLNKINIKLWDTNIERVKKMHKAMKEMKEEEKDMFGSALDQLEALDKKFKETAKTLEKDKEAKESLKRNLELLGISEKEYADTKSEAAKETIKAVVEMLHEIEEAEKQYGRTTGLQMKKMEELQGEFKLYVDERIKLERELEKLKEKEGMMDADLFRAKEFRLEKEIEMRKTYSDEIWKLMSKLQHTMFDHQNIEEKLFEKTAELRGKALKGLDEHIKELKKGVPVEELEAKIEVIEEETEKTTAAIKDQIEVVEEAKDAIEEKVDATVEGAEKEAEAIENVNKGLGRQFWQSKKIRDAAKVHHEEMDGFISAIHKSLEEGKTVYATHFEAMKIQAAFQGKLTTKILNDGRTELKLRSKNVRAINKETSALKKKYSETKKLNKEEARRPLASRFMPPEASRFMPDAGYTVHAGIAPHQERVLHDVAKKIAEGVTDAQIRSLLWNEAFSGGKKTPAYPLKDKWPGSTSGAGIRPDRKIFLDAIEELGLADKLPEEGAAMLLAQREILDKLSPKKLANLPQSLIQSSRSVFEDGKITEAEETALTNQFQKHVYNLIGSKVHPALQPLIRKLSVKEGGLINQYLDRALGVTEAMEARSQYRGRLHEKEHLSELEEIIYKAPGWGRRREDVLDVLAGGYGPGGMGDPGQIMRNWLWEKAKTARDREESIYSGGGTSISSAEDDLNEAQSRRISLLESQLSVQDSFARSIARQVGPIGGGFPAMTGESTFADAPLVTNQPIGGQPPAPTPTEQPPVNVEVSIDSNEMAKKGLESTDTDVENLFNQAMEAQRESQIIIWRPPIRGGGYGNATGGSVYEGGSRRKSGGSGGSSGSSGSSGNRVSHNTVFVNRG